MAQDENLAALRKLAEAVSSGNLAVLDEVFAPNVVDHDPLPIRDRAGWVQAFFSGLRAAFPDLTVTLDRLVQTETDIAMADTIHGTHRGEFAGIASTGRPITARGIQIARARLWSAGAVPTNWGYC
jgi:predicted ester cyclase